MSDTDTTVTAASTVSKGTIALITVGAVLAATGGFFGVRSAWRAYKRAKNGDAAGNTGS